jgi:hypothetical protein
VATLTALLIAGFGLVALFAAAGIGVIWWALFGDKANGRRRCPRCWHDLSRTPGLTCGECGFGAVDEAQFAQARRRWGVAALALVTIVAVSAWAQSSLLNRTWASWIPDAVLVRLPALVPVEAQPAELVVELRNRLSSGDLDADEVVTTARSLAADGAAAGGIEQPRAQVLQAVWFASPAEHAPVPGEPGSATSAKEAARRAFALERAGVLDALPPWFEAVPLDRFPAGGPALVGVRATIWGTEAQWRIREAGSDGPWLCGTGESGMRRSPAGSVLAVAAAPVDGRLRAKLETQVRRMSGDGTAWGPWVGGPAVVAEGPAVATDLAPLQAEDTEATHASAMQCFSQPVVAWRDDGYPVALRFFMQSFGRNGFGDMLVGLRAEILEDGVPRRRSRLWWHGSSRSGWVVEQQDTAALRRLRDAIIAASATAEPTHEGVAVPGWTVRVTAERDTAARALPPGSGPAPAWRVWAGSVEVPVRGVLEDSPSGRRGFWLESEDAPPNDGRGSP